MNSDIHDIIVSFNNAPEPIQQAIYYDEVSDLTKKIVDDWGLDEDSITPLENAINLLLLNFLPREELVSDLMVGLEIDLLTAGGIADTIDNELLSPLLEKMDLPEVFLDYISEEIENDVYALEKAATDKQNATVTDDPSLKNPTTETEVGDTKANEAVALEKPIVNEQLETTLESASEIPKVKTVAAVLTPLEPEVPTVGDSTISHVTHVGQSNTSDTTKDKPVDNIRLRTMATDMNKARSGFADDTPTYNAASQEELMTNKQKGSGDARWDSEK